jgi:hypothetical protein
MHFRPDLPLVLAGVRVPNQGFTGRSFTTRLVRVSTT